MMSNFTRKSIQISKKLQGLRYLGGGHHHGPNLPPFARQAPPTRKLPLEVENVWDDSVAPETAVDFDAPHVSSYEVFKNLGLAFGFFYSIYLFTSWYQPEKINPVAKRESILNNHKFQLDFGLISEEEYNALEGENDHHHDEE